MINQPIAEAVMATGKIKVITEGGTGYCKMEDGTLMCWGTESITRSSGQNLKTVTFPVAFSAVPTVQVTYVTGRPDIWSYSVYDKSKTGCVLCLYTSSSGSTNGEIGYLAIGRWK